MTTPEYIINVMRNGDFRYWIIKDGSHRFQMGNMVQADMDLSIQQLQNFFDNNSGFFRVEIFQTPEAVKKLKPGANPSGEWAVFETQINGIKNAAAPQNAGIGGIGSPSAFGVPQMQNMGAIPLNTFLDTKGETYELRQKIFQLEMEKEQLRRDYEREISELKTKLEKKQKGSGMSEEMILGTIRELTGMFGNPGKSTSLHGIGESTPEKQRLLNAINTLMKNDKNFIVHIEKLADMSENNSFMFKMAIEKLMSL